jgi:hypothetical protein
VFTGVHLRANFWILSCDARVRLRNWIVLNRAGNPLAEHISGMHESLKQMGESELVEE